MVDNFDRFRRFLRGMTALCDAGVDETEIRVEGGLLLRDLVASDDWLPSEFVRARSGQLSAIPAVLRSARTVFGRQLRVGTGPAHPGARSYRVGPDRNAAWLGDRAQLCRRNPAARLAMTGTEEPRPRRSHRRVADDRRHPSCRERASRPALDQHPRLWRQYRGDRAPHLRARNRRGKTLRFRLLEPRAAQSVGPLRRGARPARRLEPDRLRSKRSEP